MKKTATVWYATRLAFIIEAAVSLLLAYALMTVAIDTASLWSYAGAFLAAGLSIRLLIGAIQGHA